MNNLYLVTGASGFSGLALCKFLRDKGYKVRAVLRRSQEGPWDESVVLDLSSGSLPDGMMNGVEGVFHLAGIAHVSSDISRNRYYQVNTIATEKLLLLAHLSGVKKFVYFSSVKAVDNPGDECINEEWDARPKDYYGMSKRDAENHVLSAGEEYGMHVCNIRPALVYGIGVKGNLNKMIESISDGWFPPIPEFGNQRSMVSLHDLIQAAWLSMHMPGANGKTYIISDNQYYTTRLIYESICRSIKKKVPIYTVPHFLLKTVAFILDLFSLFSGKKMPFSMRILKNLSCVACYKSNLIQRELGWKPVDSFDDLIQDMIDNH